METNSPTTGSLVWHLALKWRTEVDRAVAGFGLTHAQYSALASLYRMSSRAEAPSQRELADYTGLRPIFMSKLVKALEAEGLLERRADAADARAHLLGLTDKGRAVAIEAMSVVRELDQRLTAPLGGPEGDQTRSLGAMLRLLLDQADQ